MRPPNADAQAGRATEQEEMPTCMGMHTITGRLKLEEARGRRLRGEIDAETMRLKAEAPALETYQSFGGALFNKCNDIPHCPELRRALPVRKNTLCFPWKFPEFQVR